MDKQAHNKTKEDIRCARELMAGAKTSVHKSYWSGMFAAMGFIFFTYGLGTSNDNWIIGLGGIVALAIAHRGHLRVQEFYQLSMRTESTLIRAECDMDLCNTLEDQAQIIKGMKDANVRSVS